MCVHSAKLLETAKRENAAAALAQLLSHHLALHVTDSDIYDLVDTSWDEVVSLAKVVRRGR